MKKKIIFLVFILILKTTFSQDDPCNATLLTTSTTCNYTPSSNVSATNTLGPPAPTCASYSGQDVWFSLVVPAGGIINIDSNTGTMTDGGMAVYSATSCSGTFTQIACDDDNSVNGAMPSLSLTGLTPGQTIYIRFWDYGGGTGTFSICVTEPPPPPSPPSNDDPCNATALPISTVCNYSTATNVNATNTAGPPDPTCASYSGQDVWFSAIVPAGGAINVDSNTGSITDGGMAVYSATSCSGTFTQIACDDDNSVNGAMPSLSLTGLTPGQTIYIRFWDYGGGTGTFSICVTEPPPPPSPPSNDDPCNATALPISTVCNYSTATNVNATNTAGPPDPTCASYSGQDVWFSAIVPAGGAINIDSNTGSITDGGMAVYSATSCSGTFTQIACDDDNSVNGSMPSLSLTGLTPGQTIYIRFWDYGGGTGTFSICVTEPTPPPPPPSNDDCIGATNLTCGTIGLPGTTASTISESAPGLTSSSYGVWYSFIGNGDNLLVSTTGTGGFDQEMTVMTGSCGAYTILTSLDGASSNGTESYNITTVVGTTYYVYVANYSTSSTTTGTFTISATCTNVPTCTGNTPAGNTCDVATPICDLNGYCGNTSDSYTPDYWTQLDNTFCGSIENNSFISFVASSANVTLNVFVESCTYGDGIQMMIYSGGCGSGPITSYACWSPGYETSGTISATGLTIGNSYYLMIDGYAGDICNYIISASSGVQLPVTLNTNNVTICTGSSTNLSVTGGNGTYTWSPNTALSSTSGSIVTANPTSTITYTVSSSTGNPLCPSSTSDQVTVNVIPLPTVTVNSQTVCSGTTSTVSATPNPLGAYNYVWTVPAGVTDPGNVASFTSNIEGNYSVVVSTNATPACSSAQATGSITFINSLSTTVNSQIICQGNSATISATSTPTGTYNYVWTVPSGFLNPGNVSSFTTSTAGAYSVVVSTTTSPTCSSNLTTGTITITPTATSTSNQTVCQTALPYAWNGLTFNAAGSQTVTLISSAGCDSLATLNLTVIPTATSTTNQTICQTALPYLWNGLTFNAAGSQTATLTSVAGCDSLATLNLTVTPTATSSTNQTICQTALPYVWNGLTFNAAGSQTATLTSIAGCDSLATLNLTVTPTATSITNQTICQTALPYVWNGLTFNAAGSQTATLTSSAGCDSLATLNLTVTPTATSATNQTVCQTALPYVWNGLTFNVAGSQTATLISSAGCDSLATLNLTVIPTATSSTNQTICQTALPFSWNGLTFNATGSQTATLTSSAGCDSLATLNLTVTPTATSATNQTVCQSALPYIWNGLTFNASGSQTATLTSSAGCDSLATLNLTIETITSSTSNQTVCQTVLPYIWNGLTFNAAGSQTATLTSIAGCDSLATLNLTVTPTATSTTNQTICQTALPYVWNGLTFNSAGSQTATLTSSAGCDSLATLNLTVTPTVTSATNQTICQTALPYFWNGLTFNASGSQTATLISSAGCDSLATLNLTVIPTATSSTNQTICQTALPYLWNGLTFNASGSQTATLISSTGCDSLATLNLTVTPTATSATNQTICQSVLPYVWNGLTFNAAGSQTATLTSIAGCDSLATLNLTIINNPILSISSLTICSGETTTLNSTVSQQGGSYYWSTGATSNSIIISPTTTTNYTLTYTLTGCNPINTSATITVNPAPVISVQSATICSGQNNTLTTIVNQSGGTYSWSTGATTASISVSPTITTNYSVSYSLGNCSIASASATVTVNPTPSITSNPQTICSGNTANITTTSSPLGGTYIWGNGQTTSTINVTPTSTTTYQVTYSLNGCSNNISTIVTVNPTPTVVITNQTICSGQSVTLTSATSPTGGTYLWSNGATTSSLVVNPLTTTNFNLLYSLNGCTANSTVIVTVNPIPTLTVANSTICSGESETLSATPNLTGGTYLWSPGGQTTATINVNPTQTTIYNVVYSLNNCSSSPSNITLTVNPIPSVNVTSSTICNGATATLNATSSITGGTWNWLSNGQQTANISVSPNQTTNYVVEYTVNGCIGSNNGNVTVIQIPVLTFTSDSQSGCVPLTVTLTNTSSIQGLSNCSWSIGGNEISTNCNTSSYTFNTPGCYDITLSSGINGCVATTTLQDYICVEAPPIASFQVNPQVFTEDIQNISFINNSSGASSYSWDFGDNSTSLETNPDHNYINTFNGYYVTLTATSLNGCSSTYSLGIPSKPIEIFYVPNTFTPDGDGYNQVFKPIFSSGYDPFNFEMTIFNRWGEIVFETSDVNIGWDGSYGVEGLDVQDGTYIYLITYKNPINDKRTTISGHVNLIR